MKRLEVAAVILAILAIVGVPTAAVAYERSRVAPDVITVTARQVEHGGWSPSSIRVERGQLVRLRLTSADVVHSLYIKELDLDSGPIYPGHWVDMEFRVQSEGELKIKCDIACGLEHTKMIAKLIVGNGGPAVAAPAAEPARPAAPASVPPGASPAAPAAPGEATLANDPVLALGKKVFETAGGDGCQDCHGADAKGRATKSGVNAPNIRGANEQKLRDALNGGAALMVFLKKELTEEQIDAVVKYLDYLTKQ